MNNEALDTSIDFSGIVSFSYAASTKMITIAHNFVELIQTTFYMKITDGGSEFLYIPFEVAISKSCSSITRDITINHSSSDVIIKDTGPLLLMTGPTGQDLLWCPEDVLNFVLKDSAGATLASSHPDSGRFTLDTVTNQIFVDTALEST